MEPTEKSTGGPKRIRDKGRALFPVLALVLALLLGNSWLIFQDLATVRRNEEIVDETNQMRLRLDALQGDLYALVASARGFLLTGQDVYLAGFEKRIQSVREETEALKTAAQSDAVVERLVQLQQTASARLDLIVAKVARYREGGLPAALRFMEEQLDKHSMDQLRAQMDDIQGELNSLLRERSRESAQSASALTRSFLLLVVLTLVLSVCTYLLIRRHLHRQREEREEQERSLWLKNAHAELAEEVSGVQNLDSLCSRVLRFMELKTGIQIGAFYVTSDDGQTLVVASAFAAKPEDFPPTLRMGEGILGEAAASNKLRHLKELPADYGTRIRSVLGEGTPREVLAVPVDFEGEVKGAIELGSFDGFTEAQWELIQAVRGTIGVALHAAQSRFRLQELLEKSQEQAEALQTQQEELKVANEELEQQASLLSESQSRLEAQHSELEEGNAQLEHQQQELEEQKTRLERINQDLRDAQAQAKARARELAAASRYKSEFLSNMSHELRTPLNSILILGQLLSENKARTMNAEQLDYANTILASARDLLTLINDVLDLAKIESGKMELNIESVPLASLLEKLQREFVATAKQKSLDFSIQMAEQCPAEIVTDEQRLTQILRNLLSNAFKFTGKGSVRLEVKRVGDGERDKKLAFTVSDTGIGIPEDRREVVFEAFRQADGTTVRQYGGTGLGLSICSELSHLLSGKIELQSEEGKGSSFTLLIPEAIEKSHVAIEGQVSTAPAASSPPAPPFGASPPVPAPPKRASTDEGGSLLSRSNEYADDRERLKPGKKTILVIEDEARFAHILQKLAARNGFQVLLAESGEFGVQDALEFVPDGILLDLNLPCMSGMEVLEKLKSNPKTRHIPVHIVSAMDYVKQAKYMGAMGYLAKPATTESLEEIFGRLQQMGSRTPKRILIVEDNANQLKAISSLLENQEIEVTGVHLATDALAELKKSKYDLVVVDLKLPDKPGIELLKEMAASQEDPPPVIVYTGKQLDREEEENLRRYSDSIIIKGARSPERLIDQTTLFLHTIENDLPARQKSLLQSLRDKDQPFEGIRILVVDDDMRNVFALSRVLEGKGAQIEIARNGQEAVEFLSARNDVDITLMDIMMPVMDGYEAMRRIRELPKYDRHPIVALTAKAMKGDEQRCFEAGASDYLTKPIDVDRLVSLLKVWLAPRGI